MLHHIQLFSLVLCLIKLGSAQTSCTTPDNRYSYCVDVTQCHPLYNYWLANQLSPEFNRFCGYYFGYTSVCCPINPIPNFNTLVPLSTRLSPPIETQSVPSNVQLPKKRLIYLNLLFVDLLQVSSIVYTYLVEMRLR